MAVKDIVWAVDGEITEEALVKQRARIGIKMSPELGGTQSRCTGLITKDIIRSIAYATGDDNPLWNDEEYAKKSPYGRLVAPPYINFAMTLGTPFHGLLGVHAFHSGTDYEFYKPWFPGDNIEDELTFINIQEKGEKPDRFWLIEDYENKFTVAGGEVKTKVIAHLTRIPRKQLKERGQYTGIQVPHPWTEEEIAQIEEEMINVHRRGSEPRFWEDVNVGDELPDLVKGPYTITDGITWFMAMNQFPGWGVAAKEYRKHPGLALIHPDSNYKEVIEAVHFDKLAGQSSGFPSFYDHGSCRQALLIQLLTDWMGDDGWLKRCSAQYRRMLFVGDVLRLKGKITKKYVDEDGEHCVDIETAGISQREENTMPGQATVALPSKEKDLWPVKQRL